MIRAGLLVVGLILAGCGSPDLQVAATAAVSPAIPTVATVQWPVVHADADNVFVEFGEDTSYGRRVQAEVDETGTARAVILGLKPGQAYTYRAVEVKGEETFEGQAEKLATGMLAVSMPSVTVTVDQPGRDRGYLVTSLLAQPSAAVIFDADGDCVWAHRPDVDWERLYIPRVRLSRVGEWVLYHAATTLGAEEEGVEVQRWIVRVSLDGTSQEVVSIPTAHHDFIELGDGTIATIAKDRKTVGDEVVEGDRILEVGWDGSERQIWSTWDHFHYDPEGDYGEPGSGWTHANALQYAMREDAYYLSLRNLDTIVKIDRATGEVRWTLGGEGSTFAVPDPPFQRQHQFRVIDDHILVFDNGTPEKMDSRVIEYALDESAGTAQNVWEHHNDPPLMSIGMGDVERLPDGNTLITWSGPGQIDEVAPDSRVLWRLQVEMGSGVGYTVWRRALFPAVGVPLARSR